MSSLTLQSPFSQDLLGTKYMVLHSSLFSFTKRFYESHFMPVVAYYLLLFSVGLTKFSHIILTTEQHYSAVDIKVFDVRFLNISSHFSPHSWLYYSLQAAYSLLPLSPTLFNISAVILSNHSAIPLFTFCKAFRRSSVVILFTSSSLHKSIANVMILDSFSASTPFLPPNNLWKYSFHLFII